MISEQELLPCDSDAFIEGTAMQMAISGIETVTLRFKGVWRSVRLKVLALAALQDVTESLVALEIQHVTRELGPQRSFKSA